MRKGLSRFGGITPQKRLEMCDPFISQGYTVNTYNITFEQSGQEEKSLFPNAQADAVAAWAEPSMMAISFWVKSQSS